jgi:hypothetical protein
VAELKRLAQVLQNDPGQMGYPADAPPRFPEAWHSIWKSPKGQSLQRQIRDKYGRLTLLPQFDGSIGIIPGSEGWMVDSD